MSTLPDKIQATGRVCPRCFVELAPDTDRCTACGQTLCPVCGAAIGEDDVRCAACGTLFDLLCPDCGAALKADDVRCPNCGAVFQSEATAAEQQRPEAPALLEQKLPGASAYAIQQLTQKVELARVEEQLVAQGLEKSTAAALIYQLRITRIQTEKEMFRRSIIDGAILIVGGLILTLVTRLSTQERGGYYLIAWGPVLFGVILLLGGLNGRRKCIQQAQELAASDPGIAVNASPALNAYTWPAPPRRVYVWIVPLAILVVAAALMQATSSSPTLNDNPTSAEDYNNRGLAYLNKGNYDRALTDLNEAIALNPQLAEAYKNRGDIYGQKGDYDRAIIDLDKAIALNPQSAEAYTDRGEAYINKGGYDRAIIDLDKA
ncbi:MAG TPA: tetratricopeptide repeat protein, partial [Anaerolineae bacterium]|nr:tetratricopeptide repeat protein [Anaerolineae bacterium]